MGDAIGIKYCGIFWPLRCPILLQFLKHWLDNNGLSIQLSPCVMRELYRSGNCDVACNQFVRTAVDFVEARLTCCDHEIRLPIWHCGERSCGANAGDVDLFNAIGSLRTWAEAEVTCRNLGGLRQFVMRFNHRLADQVVGNDPVKWEAWRCHLAGLAYDFNTCGLWRREFTWIEGDFDVRYADPCGANYAGWQ